MTDTIALPTGPGPGLPQSGVQAGAEVGAEIGAQIAAQMAAQMKLPPLREDLSLHPGPAQRNGVPTWVIEDPARGRFFRIGWLEFELLSRWSCGQAQELARRVAAQTLLKPTLEEVLAVKQFLLQHELAVNEQLLGVVRQGSQRKPGVATQALHNYLMLRLPLVNPDRFLDRTLPVVRPLLGAPALWLSLLAALVGLFFAFQQWDTFASTFVETLSLQGLLSYSVALALAKVIHELGHAYTAKRLGLRVPRMGVALVLLLPMLYTDTGETWRLTRRRDRFAIAAAGMRIELMLAAWCTLAWGFLPEGGLRSAFFFLATTSWVITLAINASPFLRFDGYYMMSDATGIPNLHDEAAKSMRHFLRGHLLGLKDPAPLLEGESAPRWLLVFGLATSIYRFFLFIGIALMVYHYFFKLLGIFLFVVEIWWFILRPIVQELKVWWAERQRIRAGAAMRLALLGLLLAGVLLVPWQGRIFAKGWVRAAQEAELYAPRPARLLSLPQAGGVGADQRLALLESSELALREARATARIESLDSRLRASAAAADSAESTGSTRAQLAQQGVEVRGVGAEARQLQLLAPFKGALVDVPPDLAAGAVVSRQEVLGRLIDAGTWVGEIFVDEDEVKRIRPGAAVRIDLLGVSEQTLRGQVEVLDPVPLEQLPSEMLAARYGGPLLTTDEANALKPRRPMFRVRVTMQGQPPMRQARLAAFVIEAERASIADSLARAAVGALVLQAGF